MFDGIVAPVLIVILLLVTSTRRILGDFVNGIATKIIGRVRPTISSGEIFAAVVGILLSLLTVIGLFSRS